MPHPRDWVVIREGVPLTVPAGKMFVLTGLGTKNNHQFGVTLELDGIEEARSLPKSLGDSSSVGWDSVSVKSVPPGFRASPGQVISLRRTIGQTVQDEGRAWGYLIDE